MTGRALGFNKACEIEDFAHPDLVGEIREVCAHKAGDLPAGYPVGSEHSKDWELAMSLRAFRHFGVLRRDARVLGVAAGMEPTLFLLTRYVGQVFATDRYYDSGVWNSLAPPWMLLDPTMAAPYPCEPERLVVQHMDARALSYPDETFDGVFSECAIEHFGELGDIANAAYEMGRVLKPGGILALSTTIKLGGVPGLVGTPGQTLLFPRAELERYVVDASGLELVDPLDTTVSEATLATERDLVASIVRHRELLAAAGPEGQRIAHTLWELPHVVHAVWGALFTSVHLTLRKSDPWPRRDNSWARPGQRVRAEIRAAAVAVAHAARSGATAAGQEAPGAGEGGGSAPTATAAVAPAGLADDLARWAASASELARETAAAAPAPMAAPVAAGREGEAAGADRDAWRFARAVVQGAAPFWVATDPGVEDPVASALASGAFQPNDYLVRLFREVIEPGTWFVDVGAHVGTISLAMAALGHPVLAIEASPRNAALLRASAARNGFRDLTVVEAAAGDTVGTVEFCARGPFGHLAAPGVDLPRVAVPMVTLDGLLAALGSPRVGLVKIDVEGAEPRVFSGMRRLLAAADAPPILYESNAWSLAMFGAAPADLVTTLERQGYRHYLVEPGRLVPWTAGDFQTQALVDLLAIRNVPRELRTSCRVDGPLTHDERCQRAAADARHAVADVREAVGRLLAGAPAATLADPRVRAALAGLADDPEPRVRAAVEWWRSAGHADEPGAGA